MAYFKNTSAGAVRYAGVDFDVIAGGMFQVELCREEAGRSNVWGQALLKKAEK